LLSFRKREDHAERAPRRRQRFARSAVLSGLAAVLALNLGLLAAVELIPRLRDPFYGDKARRLWQRLRESTEKPITVVMIGSSRTGVGFHAKLAEEQLARTFSRPMVVFNFGNPSAGPVTNLLYLRRLLAEGLRPDYLLIEVMPPFLAAERPEPLERAGFATHRLKRDELELAVRYGFPEDEIRPDLVGDRVEPVVWPARDAARPLPADRIAPSTALELEPDTDPCGWNAVPWGRPSPEEMQARIVRGHRIYGSTLAALQFGGGSAAALRDLLNLCREQNIPGPPRADARGIMVSLLVWPSC
jgi:hypothetical protein